MANDDLGVAKAAKKDAIYTSWVDIKREMNAYLEYEPRCVPWQDPVTAM